MSVIYTHKPLAAGARFDLLVTFSLETGATINNVSAVLIDKLPGSAAVTKITNTISGSQVSGNQYQFIFNNTETEKLLRTTTDKSGLLRYTSVFLALLVIGNDANSAAKTWAFYSNEIQASSSVLST